ncbi:MAG: zinc-dependent peptidase [Methylococcales bacterium]|nr:zinc-dependent peptidase [Methylococcales bacterium]
MNIFKRAYRRYILHRHAIPHDLWLQATEQQTLFQGLTAVEKAHLRELSTFFLHQKMFTGVNTDISAVMRIRVAAQACLPILALGISLFAGWSTIIIYPEAFYVDRDETDEFGFVHHNQKILSGEAWLRGPVILSWSDIEQDLQHARQGHNVVIHEIAHKLDMLNGCTNGMPPLHPGMIIEDWTAAFTHAFAFLQENIEHHHPIWIDPYAATNPAECFAVFSEYFFCAPKLLKSHFPDVYRQLRLYYRQDPLLRLPAA